MILTEDNAYLFWGGPCSQWITARINIDGEFYNTNEQYMMACKARLFKDDEALAGIMATNDPAKQKYWGRLVQGFDTTEWQKHCRLIVYRANLAKFTQHPDLKGWLLYTGEKLIVEASPEDKIWGIGLHESDEAAWNTETWQGLNWLGEAIMQVRSDIRTLAKY